MCKERVKTDELQVVTNQLLKVINMCIMLTVMVPCAYICQISYVNMCHVCHTSKLLVVCHKVRMSIARREISS